MLLIVDIFYNNMVEYLEWVKNQGFRDETNFSMYKW